MTFIPFRMPTTFDSHLTVCGGAHCADALLPTSVFVPRSASFSERIGAFYVNSALPKTHLRFRSIRHSKQKFGKFQIRRCVGAYIKSNNLFARNRVKNISDADSSYSGIADG